MKLSEIAKEINATLHGQDRELPPIVIDSRKVQSNDLFVALKGENHDGHDFIEASIQNGASVIVATSAPQTSAQKSVSFLQVKDTTIALGEIASMFRRKYPIPMVGLTGSCGKTSVKGMIESICQEMGKTLATKGNFNNHFGLPLTLMRLDASYQYAVIEMGASGMGEIKYLGGIAHPNITLITNVRPAHLLGFGTLENVAKAKGEIYEILPKEGIAIVNVDEPFSESWLDLIKDRRKLTFGLKNKADIYATQIKLQPFSVEFTLHIHDKSQKVSIATPGEHTVMNALAAATAGVALNIPLDRIVKGLQSFEGVPGRLRRFKGLQEAWIIDDSYNANPGSVNAALDVLSQCQGKKIFVMGDMAELGDNAIEYHALVGQDARKKGIDHILAVGKLSEHTVKAFGDGATFFQNKDDLVTALKNNLNAQTVILVKGSRSAKMEVITHALTVREEA